MAIRILVMLGQQVQVMVAQRHDEIVTQAFQQTEDFQGVATAINKVAGAPQAVCGGVEVYRQRKETRQVEREAPVPSNRPQQVECHHDDECQQEIHRRKGLLHSCRLTTLRLSCRLGE